MPTKYRDLSPEARERAKKKGLEYYYLHKNDPNFIETRRNWHKQKAEKTPGFWLGKYQKNPEHFREYARKIRARDKKPSGTPGTLRYEARLAGFRSGFERTVDLQLKSSGVDYAYEDTEVPYTLECKYNPDFHLLHNDIFIETKGVLSVDDRRKHITLKKQHPKFDVRFVFMREGTRIQHGKMTNEIWAAKNGFLFAVEKIPQEWLEEKRIDEHD